MAVFTADGKEKKAHKMIVPQISVTSPRPLETCVYCNNENDTGLSIMSASKGTVVYSVQPTQKLATTQTKATTQQKANWY